MQHSDFYTFFTIALSATFGVLVAAIVFLFVLIVISYTWDFMYQHYDDYRQARQRERWTKDIEAIAKGIAKPTKIPDYGEL